LKGWVIIFDPRVFLSELWCPPEAGKLGELCDPKDFLAVDVNYPG